MEELILRSYQKRAIEELRQKFAGGARKLLLYAPTGAGKTQLSVDLMKKAMEKGTRTAFIVDRVVLVDQTSRVLERYGIPHGVIQAGHWRYRPNELIQICSAQTIEARGFFPDTSLLIVDECHCVRDKITHFIQSAEKTRVVGLSASPFSKKLGAIYDDIVSPVTTQQLVEGTEEFEPCLSSLRVFVSKEIDMDGAKTQMGEWTESEAITRGIKISGDVVAEWIKKTHEIFGEPRKTIVFSAGVAHSEDLVRRFNEAGYNFISISYLDSDEYKKEVMEDFSRENTEITGLIATDILTKGFDAPDVMLGISARPFKSSFSSHVQQLGRLMRPYGDNRKAWICHSGNYLRFLSKWEKLYENGVDELESHKDEPVPEPTIQEKEAAKCPMCGSLWPKGSDTCPNCGHIRVRVNQVQEVSAELIELTSGGKKEKKKKDVPIRDKQSWYSQFLHYEMTTGKKKGWAGCNYRDVFGVYPRGLEIIPSPPTPEVLQWISDKRRQYFAIKASRK